MWMSVICAISIAWPPPTPSPARDSRRSRGCPLARMVAMAHRAARRHLCRARALALVAVAALGDPWQQQVRGGAGGLGGVAACALLLLVILVIEPAVEEIAALLGDRRDRRRGPAGRGQMTFAAQPVAAHRARQQRRARRRAAEVRPVERLEPAGARAVGDDRAAPGPGERQQ